MKCDLCSFRLVFVQAICRGGARGGEANLPRTEAEGVPGAEDYFSEKLIMWFCHVSIPPNFQAGIGQFWNRLVLRPRYLYSYPLCRRSNFSEHFLLFYLDLITDFSGNVHSLVHSEKLNFTEETSSFTFFAFSASHAYLLRTWYFYSLRLSTSSFIFMLFIFSRYLLWSVRCFWYAFRRSPEKLHSESTTRFHLIICESKVETVKRRARDEKNELTRK